MIGWHGPEPPLPPLPPPPPVTPPEPPWPPPSGLAALEPQPTAASKINPRAIRSFTFIVVPSPTNLSEAIVYQPPPAALAPGGAAAGAAAGAPSAMVWQL